MTAPHAVLKKFPRSESRRARTFTNNAITYIIVLLGGALCVADGAIAMTGEWRHRTITGAVLAAPGGVRVED
jgi:hypothetical protein